MDSNKTIRFNPRDITDTANKRILSEVYEALREKGYDPRKQLVGYIISEDPAYITNYNNARSKIRQIDRYDLILEMLDGYLSLKK